MASPAADPSGLVSGLMHTVTASPLNVFLTAVCIGLVYLIFKSASPNKKETGGESRKVLEPFPKGDMTLDELKKYDGRNEDGRILLAVNREIYDVSRGYRFYGPEGSYAPLGGHDATRALATFVVDAVKDEWDDYSDLTISQMNTVTEWIEQFREKYQYVGKLVKTEAEKSVPVDEEPDDKE